MYHSIYFDGKNTWEDWHLIPASRPLFNPPTPRTNLVDIPGGNGSLDLTESLTGKPTYQNRTGSWTFYVENGFRDWYELYSEIMSYLHGRKMRAVLEDDPAYYYEGRFSINAWKSDRERSSIVIDYDVYPFKRSVFASFDDWLWDTFNFLTDSIHYYQNLPVRGELRYHMFNEDENPVYPVFYATADGMSVEYAGQTYPLTKGFNYMDEFQLQNGENELVFRGNGEISIGSEGRDKL